jgi:GT2 family glycosyltransferase
MSVPTVSVIVAAYNSHVTIAGTLEALGKQTRRDFEVIVVDSSPNETTADIMRRFPWVRYIHSKTRLGPHAARNLGAEHAQGDLLVFTDADAYAVPEWIERLVEAHRETGKLIVGGIDCYGGKWIDWGNHFCKFDKWLPGGPPRPIDIAPTVNFMIPVSDFEAAGRYDADTFLADTTFSWTLNKLGKTLYFVPAAAIAHHHLASFGDLIRERYRRGKDFGGLRLNEQPWSRSRVWLWWIFSLLPLRALKLIGRTATNSARANRFGWFVLTLPASGAGHYAWLLGEAAAYRQYLRRNE